MEGLVYALSIEERIKCRSLRGAIEPDYNNLEWWKGRKSLCKGELFYKSLKIKQMSEIDIANGLRNISETENYLLDFLHKIPWYKLHKDILEQKDANDSIDMSYPIRFHKIFIENEIKNILEAKKAKIFLKNPQDVVKNIITEFTSICKKTIIYDMHFWKRKEGFFGETPEDRFRFYMIKRFGTRSKVGEFFEEYPVLAKLLATRTEYHIKNFKFFLSSIISSRTELMNIFSINEPIIRLVDLSVGDSHSHGKSVIIFEMNCKKLVFKFKSLKMGEQFNEFLNRVEKYSTFSKFKSVRRVIGENYTIEEFIENRECISESDVKDYYYKFGEYIAIGYILCINDLHFENLVAFGKYPVLIDIETIIQNDSPVDCEKSGGNKVISSILNSILETGLLPIGNMTGDKDEVRMSALDNGKQILPHKVLHLTHPLTDEMKYEYLECEIDGAKNIPLLNQSEISYKDYTQEILKGMLSLLSTFYVNKDKLLKDVEELFSNIIVRNIIKPTQKYVDMLEYGLHPSCMKDYIEREKLFENLWGYPYKNLYAVPYEINDLLDNDVPIFFNNTSSKDLITSTGQITKGYYANTAIERVKKRIRELDSSVINLQRNLAMLSLNMYKGTSQYYKIQHLDNKTGSGLITYAEDIGRLICQKAVWGWDGTVSWADIVTNDYTKWCYTNVSIDLYSGLSGIYLFLLFLSQISKEKYEHILEAIELVLFERCNSNPMNLCVYHGKASVLYPFYWKWRLTKDDKYIDKIKEYIECFDNLNDERVKDDWLTGRLGFLKVCINIYTITQEVSILKQIETIVDDINVKRIKNTGFAHGFSGAAFALFEAYKILGDKKILYMVEKCISKEDQLVDVSGAWLDTRKASDDNQVWCHGAAGIGMVRLRLLEANILDAEWLQRDLYKAIKLVCNQSLGNDCLCHGFSGVANFLYEVCNSRIVDMRYKKIAYKYLLQITKRFCCSNFKVRGMIGIPNLGLMTGLSGVGYTFLRINGCEVPNVLLLD